jgi:geranylgeranyl reductase family protein
MTDVLVVGGGPAGASTAHHLAQCGLDVMVLDRSEFPRDKTCGDALTPRAVRVVDDMGLLPELLAVGAPIRGYDVVAPNGRATHGAIPATPTTPDLALVVRRHELDARLLGRALRSGARLESGLTITGLEGSADRVRVWGERGGRTVSHQAPLAVLATGASMGLLRNSGILRALPRTMLAARAYVSNIPPAVARDRLQLRFDAAPLPGYGWIFPVAGDAANVGVGFFPGRRSPATAAQAFERFVQAPAPRRLLWGGRLERPVKSYPIRVDFLTAPHVGQRLLLVGEAAGLVNPLTGEGIDYALESGQLAARRVATMFELGDFSSAQLALYDRELGEHFARLFRFCAQVRDWYLRAPLLNVLVSMANRRADLRGLLTNIVLGNEQASERGPARGLLKLLST